MSIIVPAYNEEERLPQTLGRIDTYLKGQDYSAEIIVVDDGSTDRTSEVAQAFAEDRPYARVLREDHRGKGYAVRAGMLASRGEIALFSDADLSTPIEETDKLLPWFEKSYDVVIGSREGKGAHRYDEPYYRHLMGRIFNWLVRALTVSDIQDTQCGFKAFRCEAAQGIFERVQLYGAEAGVVTNSMVTGFDVELLFLAQKKSYQIKEVPVEWYYSKATKVHPLKDSWRNFLDVLRVRWNDLRGLYDE